MSLLPLALSLLAAQPVDVQIAVREPTLWVGEPIRMDVRWVAFERGAVRVESDDRCLDSTRLLVEGPGGKGVYREPARDSCCRIVAPRQMHVREEARTRLVFFSTGGWLTEGVRSTRFERSLLFEQPGEYRLRLAYTGGKRDVLSNTIRVTVVMPSPEETPLLDQIREKPWITYGDSDWLQRVRQNPTSRYLAWTRLSALSDRLIPGGIVSDRKAETDRRLGIVSEILAQDWGQWEEDALGVAFRGAIPAGRGGLAAEIAAKLLAKYPDSVTVRQLGLEQQYGGERGASERRHR